MNPRAAINDLHPFQGCPFGQLGYFSESFSNIALQKKYDNGLINAVPLSYSTERVGFEPTRPCGQTVFKTASL